MTLIKFCGNGIYVIELTICVTNLRTETFCVINFLLNSKTEEFLRVTVLFFFKWPQKYQK